MKGINGQEKSYLAELLLEIGYVIHGFNRQPNLFKTQRANQIYQDPYIDYANFNLNYRDLTDIKNLLRIVQETQPDEICNLGAQSHVAGSFGWLFEINAKEMCDEMVATDFAQAKQHVLHNKHGYNSTVYLECAE